MSSQRLPSTKETCVWLAADFGWNVRTVEAWLENHPSSAPPRRRNKYELFHLHSFQYLDAQDFRMTSDDYLFRESYDWPTTSEGIDSGRDSELLAYHSPLTAWHPQVAVWAALVVSNNRKTVASALNSGLRLPMPYLEPRQWTNNGRTRRKQLLVVWHAVPGR